jgi:hypothetical protein
MGTISTTARVKSATISAKVIRADGSVEDLGVIASTKVSILDRIRAFIRRII